MLAGICLNVLTDRAAAVSGLSVYPASAGTILAAALAGYIPGIVTGFISTLLISVFAPDMIYYEAVVIALAAMTAWLSSRGFFEKAYMAVAASLALTCTAGTLKSIISWMITAFNIADHTGNSDHSKTAFPMGGFGSYFLDELVHEFADIALAVLVVFVILKLIPARVRRSFSYNAYDRICGDGEITFKKDTADRRHSLKIKIVGIVLTGIILVTAVSAGISYHLYKNSTINDRIRLGEALTGMAADIIDPEMVSEYLIMGEKAAGYTDTQSSLYWIRDAYPDVKYLYVYRISEDGCHVVFDLDTEDQPGGEPGSVVEFDPSFDEYRDELLKGEEVAPIISNDSFGYLLTIYKPLYDKNGQCVCYIGADFSMYHIRDFGFHFLMRTILIQSGFFIIILLLTLTFINHGIVAPINIMARITGAFKYDTPENREENAVRLRSISIRTADEIENLYRVFLRSIEDNLAYVKKQQEQMNIISAIAGVYDNMYELDMRTLQITEILEGPFPLKQMFEGRDEDIQTILNESMALTTDAAYLDAILEFIDLSTLNDRFRDTDILTIEPLNKNKTWKRCRLIVSSRDKDGNVIRVIWATENIDREVRTRERLHDIAFTDSLTGLGNKAAYDEKTRPFDEAIGAGDTDDLFFAILMVDLNFLKKVNDTYGHENGNIYLINCAKTVSQIYGASSSYRFGGDEFVVVLSGSRAGDSESLTADFKERLKEFEEDENLKPWEKVSAAVGISHFDPAADHSVEDVFKRADKNMYEDKLAMKAVRKE